MCLNNERWQIQGFSIERAIYEVSLIIALSHDTARSLSHERSKLCDSSHSYPPTKMSCATRLALLQEPIFITLSNEPPQRSCSLFKMFSGEALCGCGRRAYYGVPRGPMCGRCSRKYLPLRKALPKRKKPEFDMEKHMAELHADGGVVLQKMRMMKSVEQKTGWLCVFPNNRHGSRKDGYGCSELSPMQLGPVKHNQPGLPDALNLENFWQQSKRFASETDEQFITAQRAGFIDPVAHRHKIKGEKPLYWSWKDEKLEYVVARQFYCNYYERLAKETESFRTLKRYHITQRLNLQICGYDAYEVAPTKDALEQAYLNGAKSFGHELVLFSMLVLLNEDDYPWRIHKTFDF